MKAVPCSTLTGIAFVLLFMASAAFGGTIRADKSDSLYTSLANQSAYACVGEFNWTESGSDYIASGTLINDQWILTAAHVVSGINSGNIHSMTFTIGGTAYNVSEVHYNSGWTGSISNGYDIGLVKLDSVVSGISPAYLYTGTSELRKITTVVGYGKTGTGFTGSINSAGTKRAGTNVLGMGSALNSISWTSGGNDTMLVADFDAPGTTGDPTTNLAVATDLEYCAAPGDSGGGWFMNVGGQDYLAGVTSFLNSNPVNTQQAQYGDIFGSTRVSSYLSWIRQYTVFSTQVIAGDANKDGRVNVLDLGVLASNYATASGAVWATGDFSGDGKVNVIDLGILASNYGSSYAGMPAGTVPEPMTMSVLAMGIAGLLPGRSRR